jgi:hypothetical protein
MLKEASYADYKAIEMNFSQNNGIAYKNYVGNWSNENGF